MSKLFHLLLLPMLFLPWEARIALTAFEPCPEGVDGALLLLLLDGGLLLLVLVYEEPNKLSRLP